MAPKNLSTDQKLDLILEKVTNLDEKVIVIDGKVDKMQSDITDLIELTSTAMNLAAVTSDRVDKLESKSSFTPFKSGAFVV